MVGRDTRDTDTRDTDTRDTRDTRDERAVMSAPRWFSIKKSGSRHRGVYLEIREPFALLAPLSSARNKDESSKPSRTRHDGFL